MVPPGEGGALGDGGGVLRGDGASWLGDGGALDCGDGLDNRLGDGGDIVNGDGGNFRSLLIVSDSCFRLDYLLKVCSHLTSVFASPSKFNNVSMATQTLT